MKFSLESYSGRLIWEGEAESTKAALLAAFGGGADLSGADLRGADLSGADLSGADLRDADLRDADLRGADLRGADLRDAVLRGADLRGADLSDADLSGAVLSGADLSGADLRGADLSGAEIPKIPNIDSVILAAVKQDGCALKMADWHSCGTTHCRGGWAIHLAGDAGKDLERVMGPNVAAALIYATSNKSGKVPNFFASDEAAMADLEACAAEEAK